MDVQVVHTLATLGAIINDCAISLLRKTFLSGNFGSYNHKVAKESCMPIFSFGDSSETITVFGDHKEMLGGHWCDIAECQTLIIFVDNI